MFSTIRKSKTHNFSYRSLSNIDMNMVQLDLEQASWQVMYDLETINEKVEYLTSTIVRIFDKHAPLRKIVGKKNRIRHG